MCQYSAKNGNPSKWHYKHLSNLSATGASMVILESTAIEKSGKISNSDLCLYNDTHMKNLSHLIKYLKKEMILNLVFKFLIQDVKDLAIYLGKSSICH